jgi:hypothetical protein
MSNLFHKKSLNTKTIRGIGNVISDGFFDRPFLKTFGLPMALTLLLGGCQAPAVKPQAEQLNQISRILVVPVESPPLEVTPDLIRSRLPAYNTYAYETVPSSLLMNKKLYMNPGGILIAGMVAESETMDAAGFLPWDSRPPKLDPADQPLKPWSPSRILAQNAAEQLTTDGVKATLSGSTYWPPMVGNYRETDLGGWHRAIGAWYEQNYSAMEYKQPDWHQFDAILEVGIGSYRILENQTSLQVLVKLVDPHTGQVIGRTSAQTYSAEDSAKSLLSRESESFKRLVTGLGNKLVARGLSDLGLPFRPHQVALKQDDSARL